MTSQSAVDRLLRRVLRGEAVDWNPRSAPCSADQVLDRSAFHGVQGLLHQRLQSSDWGRSWPAEACERLARSNRQAAVLEMVRQRELGRVLDALAEAGVPAPVLMKGAALAYTLYPAPGLRPRGDADLLIRRDDLSAFGRVLTRLGYAAYPIRGNLITCETAFDKRDPTGIEHQLDVHWRISSAHPFGRVIDFAAASGAAVAIPALHERARGLSPVHALLLACLHRAVSLHSKYYVDGEVHYGADRLIWLYDVHLLVNRMTPEEIGAFIELCRFAGVCAVCRDAVERARACFGTPLPEGLLQDFTRRTGEELSAGYLRASRLDALLIDLRALPHWRDRAGLVREYALPPREYLRSRYNAPAGARPAALYLRYWLDGVHRFLVKGTGRPRINNTNRSRR